MRKIMLVIDDYNELVAMENFFRRLGFDVLSINKDLLVSDAVLRFIPDLVIATAKGRMVDGAKVALKIGKSAPSAVMALVMPKGSQVQLSADLKTVIDTVIETPVGPSALINQVAQLLSLDAAPLLEKFERQNTTRAKTNDRVQVFAEENEGQESTYVTGGSVSGGTAASDANTRVGGFGSTASVRTARSDGYDKFLRDHDDGPIDGTLTRAKAAEYIKKLKKESEAEWKELEELTDKKREFVQVLFREGHKKPKA